MIIGGLYSPMITNGGSGACPKTCTCPQPDPWPAWKIPWGLRSQVGAEGHRRQDVAPVARQQQREAKLPPCDWWCAKLLRRGWKLGQKGGQGLQDAEPMFPGNSGSNDRAAAASEDSRAAHWLPGAHRWGSEIAWSASASVWCAHRWGTKCLSRTALTSRNTLIQH